MQEIFLQITIIIVLSALIAVIFKVLKQPTILAYIFTGILISLLGVFPENNGHVFNSLSKIGITLLLFMLGLEIQVNELKSVGKTVLVAGVGQTLLTAVIGFLLCKLIGFSNLTSFYASLALTFSSTIVVVKLLSDKKDVNSLYGKISIGFLLVQDFFAILALIILSSISDVSSSFSVFDLAVIFIKIMVLFGVIIYMSHTVFPFVIHKIASSQEILLLASLAWALGLAAFVSSPLIGFSVEIGGFLAGLSLAKTSESFQIASKIKPIRDFFIMIFFVLLGMEMQFHNISTVILPSLLLSVFVLIGNPFIVMSLLGFLGYTKRISFMTSLTSAQISEFSLIVIIIGNSLGHVSDEIVSIITIVAIITFMLSSYAMLKGNEIFAKISNQLSIFERKKTKHNDSLPMQELQNHVILAGADRLGSAFLEDFKNDKDKILIIDFNPDIIEKYKNKGYNVLYGDIADADIQEKANLSQARMLISSIPDLDDTLIFLKETKELVTRPIMIAVARYKEDKALLRKAGADYVILPHAIIGKTLSAVVKTGSTELLEKSRRELRKAISTNFNEKQVFLNK